MFRFGGREQELNSGYRHKPRGKFNRIMLFCTTTVNGGHLASLADILLGGFRYCVNNATSAKDPQCEAMFSKLFPMFWGSDTDSGRKILEKGLMLRPRETRIRKFEDLKIGLLAALESYLEGSTIS